MARKRKNPLTDILDKAGVTNIDQLAPEELATFNRYKLILSQEVTVDTIKEFAQNQLRLIESKSDGIMPLSMLQQACIHIYINFLKLIEAPEIERHSLELMLNQVADAIPRHE